MLFEKDQIQIHLDKIINKDFAVSNIIILYDLFSKHYQGQPILFVDHDAVNFYQSGFLDLVSRLQQIFLIPDQHITFQTVGPPPPRYNHVPPLISTPEKFFKAAGNHCTNLTDFDILQGKFVGALAASRFSIMRWLTLYELDQAFPNDTYLTFKGTADNVKNQIQHYHTNYSKELAWTATKNFDHYHMDSSDLFQAMNGLIACSWYGQIWHRYAIEVVMETDEFANSWLTEKTARCLAVGRPFVLLAGPRSLQNLREQGYHTFGDIISDKYDKELTPTRRLQSIITSLQKLYTDSNRQNLLQQIFEIAQLNKNIYKKNVQSTI